MTGDACRCIWAEWWATEPAAVAQLTGDVTIWLGGETAARPWASIATGGLSEYPLAPPPATSEPAPERLELVTYAAAGEVGWPVVLLEQVVVLAASGGGIWPYQMIDLGGPVDGADSSLEATVLLPAYFEPGQPRWLHAIGQVAVLWAVPITREELEYGVMAGPLALEAALIDADLRPAGELQRRSVVS